jgi:hypothetical protein
MGAWRVNTPFAVGMFLLILVVCLINVIVVEIRSRRKKTEDRESNAEAIAIGARLVNAAYEANQPTATPKDCFFKCPECGQQIPAWSGVHRHVDDGSIVLTQDLRLYHLFKKWERGE